MRLVALLLTLCALPAWSADELTVYDLLAPGTHSFDIIYDVTATREGAPYFFNPIRVGSVATKERVVDRATGKPLEWSVVDGKSAKAGGFVSARTADDAQFLRVKLAQPVPKSGETRIRIYKTYTDPPSYYETAGGFVFDRPLGIKRNVVILPKGYELTGSASPSMVSTDADGRVRLSFLNDRDDQLPVKITGKETAMKWLLWLLPVLAYGQFHRAEQDREIRYWLMEPETHQFKISHDFTITRVGQKSAHSFVRKGSTVNADAKMYNLDTGEALPTKNVSGKSVNALGYYPTPTEDDSVVVQGDLAKAVAEGESVRIRCVESYTDSEGYFVRNGELAWSRTLGRPVNFVTLPSGWMLTSLNSPAVVTLDTEGRVTLRFTNIRNDNLAVTIHAKKR